MKLFESGIRSLWIVQSYLKARHLQKKLCRMTRTELKQYQQRKLERFTCKVLVKSPYFKAFAALPFEQWPLMDKQLMMAEFDRMNTEGLHGAELMAGALHSEQTRDSLPANKDFCAGLSSGTSGRRGMFVTSRRERACWAGTALAKLLPGRLLGNERIALFLRADNQLYQDINSKTINLRFFDLFSSFDRLCRDLEYYAPTVIVAPAQVLRELALKRRNSGLKISPMLVVSAAEVLGPQDRMLLEQSFEHLAEIYQATEGFLGATCAHGRMHLNEEYLLVEPQWLDGERFIPVITDFTRRTQPIIRYRLDDVLAVDARPCPCGSAAMAIKHIEGRCDDQLLLPGKTQDAGESVTIFADVCHRALALALPLECDYRLVQSDGAEGPLLTLWANAPEEALHACREHLSSLFRQQGAAVEHLCWQLNRQPPAVSFQHKRRRIMRESAAIR